MREWLCVIRHSVTFVQMLGNSHRRNFGLSHDSQAAWVDQAKCITNLLIVCCNFVKLCADKLWSSTTICADCWIRGNNLLYFISIASQNPVADCWMRTIASSDEYITNVQYLLILLPSTQLLVPCCLPIQQQCFMKTFTVLYNLVDALCKIAVGV